MSRLSPFVIAALLIATSSLVALADNVRWPAHTNLPRPDVTSYPPAAPLIRAPSAAVPTVHAFDPRLCSTRKLCIVCVANCAERPTPSIVHAQRQVRTAPAKAETHAENDPDGVPMDAPRFGRPSWAAIACGSTSGCVARNVIAPAQPMEVHVTVIRRELD